MRGSPGEPRARLGGTYRALLPSCLGDGGEGQEAAALPPALRCPGSHPPVCCWAELLCCFGPHRPTCLPPAAADRACSSRPSSRLRLRPRAASNSSRSTRSPSAPPSMPSAAYGSRSAASPCTRKRHRRHSRPGGQPIQGLGGRKEAPMETPRPLCPYPSRADSLPSFVLFPLPKVLQPGWLRGPPGADGPPAGRDGPAGQPQADGALLATRLAATQGCQARNHR